MAKQFLLIALAAAMLQSPLHAAAAGKTEVIRLDPPADMASAPTIGMLSVCCDKSMSGSIFEVHLYQEEGDLLYYSFTAKTGKDTQVECPFKKDGDYQLIVKLPQEKLPDRRSYCYAFSVQDPDPADHPSDFDATELTMRFSVDPSLESDRTDEHQPELKNRTYKGESTYNYARKAFLPGDANSDGIVNAEDATSILIAAAAMGVNQSPKLSSLEAAQGELNDDGVLNAKDALIVLSYAAAIGVNSFSGNAAEFAESRNMQ